MGLRSQGGLEWKIRKRRVKDKEGGNGGVKGRIRIRRGKGGNKILKKEVKKKVVRGRYGKGSVLVGLGDDEM